MVGGGDLVVLEEALLNHHLARDNHLCADRKRIVTCVLAETERALDLSEHHKDVAEEWIGRLHASRIRPAEDRAQADEKCAGGHERHSCPVVCGEATTKEGDRKDTGEDDDTASEHLEDGGMCHGQSSIHGAGAKHIT